MTATVTTMISAIHGWFEDAANASNTKAVSAAAGKMNRVLVSALLSQGDMDVDVFYATIRRDLKVWGQSVLYAPGRVVSQEFINGIESVWKHQSYNAQAQDVHFA